MVASASVVHQWRGALDLKFVGIICHRRSPARPQVRNLNLFRDLKEACLFLLIFSLAGHHPNCLISLHTLPLPIARCNTIRMAQHHTAMIGLAAQAGQCVRLLL